MFLALAHIWLLPYYILRYYDNLNYSLAAVKEVYFSGRERDIVVAYTRQGNAVTLLTLHPLKDGQQQRRLESGRWSQL